MDSGLFVVVSLLASSIVGGGVKAGSIEGHLMFPSCNGPDDLRVCAESEDGGASYCTRPAPGPAGFTYKLEVPAGRYQVYAEAESVRPGYRAYFSNSVVCGLKVECSDHTPITVVVEPGRTRAGVHPADWFNQSNRGALAWNQ